MLKEPMPDVPDSLFLEFTTNGNRSRCDNVLATRRLRLTVFTLAECVENKGRFLPALEQAINAICTEKTWVGSAHDSRLANFNGKANDIDLYSSALAWQMATLDWLLGDKLSANVRKNMRDNIRRRVLDPFRDMYNGKLPENGWMHGTNNWNAVCLAGVVGAALEQIDSPQERAEFIVAGEKYSRNFLAGFTPDGYCSEGLGYWNYGFGHYILLSEVIRQATGDKLDLMERPEVKAPATFGCRIQIINGVAPAFADCSVEARPSPQILYYVNRRYGLGMHAFDELDASIGSKYLFEMVIYAFPNGASERKPAGGAAAGPGLRDWFDKAGILICRPAAGSTCRMGVALKGGHNAEHHNHNDVGSYVVVLGEHPVLLDPGAERYTARTFSSRRYESKLLNSFGHAVPMVANQLQQTGRRAEAKILRTEFTDSSDTLEMDIRSAYPVKELDTLVRTFTYCREKAGSLTVADRVEFSSPQAFGTALITAGTVKKLPDGKLLIQAGNEAVTARIDAGGNEYELQMDEIHEDGHVKPTRIGVNLARPVTSATITVKIEPSEQKVAEKAEKEPKTGKSGK